MTLLRIAFCALAILLAPSSSYSAPDPINQAWAEELERIDELLLDGEFKKAEKKSVKLAEDMKAKLGTNRAAAPVLARTVAYRAIAEAGRGELEAAEWTWLTALNLDPEVADRELDLERFGEPGSALAAWTLRDPKAWKGAILNPDNAPSAIKKAAPKYPRAARIFHEVGRVGLNVILDETGRPTSPAVFSKDMPPTLILAALEAVREWRFEPAIIDGEPAPLFYNVIIDFSLKSQAG